MRLADEKFFQTKTLTMASKSLSQKAECLNPNTGGKMNIDKDIYELFSKAIHQSLKPGKALSFSEIVEAIHDRFYKQKTKFKGSLGWYAVTVKNDMQVRGIIEVFIEKGKKMHRLKK
jgi:hypothetical protein